MVRFTLPGSRRWQYGLAAALCLAATFAVVRALDRQRNAPELDRLEREHAQLAQTLAQMEARPPAYPVHWHMRRLRQLARTLPNLAELKAVKADPQRYPEPLSRHTRDFGGEVWKVAVQGPLLSAVALCRMAQPLMPLVVDSIRVRDGQAQLVLFVVGAAHDAAPELS